MTSEGRILCLSVILKLLVVQAEYKYTENSIHSEDNGPHLCESNSIHPKPFVAQNVCITKDYSILKEPNENIRTHVEVVFANHKVVSVDDKNKEVTLDIHAFLFWKDERINATIPQHKYMVDLPPLTSEWVPVIWSPFSRIEIPNMRNRKYLFDPIMAPFFLKRVGLVDRMSEDFSSLGNTIVVQSIINWSVTISCPFEFASFPFDRNQCLCKIRFWDIDISLKFAEKWKNGIEELTGQRDINGFKVVIALSNATQPPNVYFSDVTLLIDLQRLSRIYIYQYYIPCITIVIASSFSFIIPLSAIPGRVALIVTQFLTLTNIFINQIVSIHG